MLVKSAKNLRSNLSKNSGEARNLLPKGSIDIKLLKGEVDKQLKRLMIGGKLPQAPEDIARYDALMTYKKSLSQYKNMDLKSFMDLRKKIQLVDLDPKAYGRSSAEYSDKMLSDAKKAVADKITEQLRKQGGEDYLKKMRETAKEARTQDYLRKSRVLPSQYAEEGINADEINKFISNVGKGGSKELVTKNVLRQLDKSGKTSMLPHLKTFEQKSKYLNKGEIPDKLLENKELSSHIAKEMDLGRKNIDKNKASRVTYPDIFRKKDQGSIDLISKLTGNDLRKNLSDYDKSSTKHLESLKKFESVKNLGPSQSQQWLRSKYKDSPSEPLVHKDEIADNISKEFKMLTGEDVDLKKAMKDRGTFEAFLKTNMNGSRLVNLFRAVSNFIPFIPPRVSEGAAAIGGAKADVEGPMLYKKLLDKIIKYRDPIKKSADILYPLIQGSQDIFKYSNSAHALNRAYINAGLKKEDKR